MLRDPCKKCLVKACCRTGCYLFIDYRNKFQIIGARFTFVLAIGVILTAIIMITIFGLLGGSEVHEKYEKLSKYSSIAMILIVVINSFFNYYLFARISKEIETRFER